MDLIDYEKEQEQKELDELFNLSLDKDIDKEVDKLFNYYRKQGFPHYLKEDYDINKEYKKLTDLDENKLFNNTDKSIKQNMIGNGFLWTYFPHWIEIKCGNSTESLIDNWNDDLKLKELIKKTYIWKCKHKEYRWNQNRIRQNSKVFLAKQSVSNFRPSVAKFIYNKYGNFGNVLDMSSGFGGRLFGFHTSKCKSYIGFEPSTKTYNGLLELKRDLNSINYKNIEIRHCGSEIYKKEYKETIDLCFTSPPYFDTEKYSEEETQSYKKYPTFDLWLNGFLRNTIKNCYSYLKKKRYLLINIANTPKYKNIEEETIRIAKDIGFKHIDTLYMELSSIAKNKGRKTEPIFVFFKE